MNLYTACFYKRKVNKHSQIQLAHYCPVLLIYTPWKHQKPKGFLMFLGGIDKQHWTVMG